MSNIAFYVVSDVHGYIFPTDFTVEISISLWDCY